jgi:hypothetical protein
MQSPVVNHGGRNNQKSEHSNKNLRLAPRFEPASYPLLSGDVNVTAATPRPIRAPIVTSWFRKKVKNFIFLKKIKNRKQLTFRKNSCFLTFKNSWQKPYCLEVDEQVVRFRVHVEALLDDLVNAEDLVCCRHSSPESRLVVV